MEGRMQGDAMAKTFSSHVICGTWIAHVCSRISVRGTKFQPSNMISEKSDRQKQMFEVLN